MKNATWLIQIPKFLRMLRRMCALALDDVKTGKLFPPMTYLMLGMTPQETVRGQKKFMERITVYIILIKDLKYEKSVRQVNIIERLVVGTVEFS